MLARKKGVGYSQNIEGAEPSTRNFLTVTQIVTEHGG